MILIFSNDKNESLNLKEQLKKNFSIKILGQTKRCLDLNIEKNKSMNLIAINQKDYILELLNKFSLSKAKDVVTPMTIDSKFDFNDKKIDVSFQQLIDALMYLAVNTEPDIAFATSFLSQFNLNHDALSIG